MVTRSGRLVVLGEALIDLVEHGDDDPRLARPGGSPYNVAIGLARLGRDAAFVGRLSRDPLGGILRRHAERSEVDLSLCIDAAEPSTIALVELSDGIAQYRFGIDGTADFCFTDAELRAVDDATQHDGGIAALHFGSLTSWTPPGDGAVARFVASLRGRALVSYDPNVRPQLQPDPKLARAQVERALQLAQLVKTSEEDLDYLYPGVDPDEIAQDWLGDGPSVVVITRGGDGATARTAAHRVHRPVGPTRVVDTVGAGDAFMSGLLDSLAGRDLLNAGALATADEAVLAAVLDDASLVAAITCSRAGANPPRRAELDALRSGVPSVP